MTGAVAYLLIPLPPCNSLPAKFDDTRRPNRTTCVCCAKGVAANPDDYHATVKALNSRGHVPQKSLGQIVAAAGVKEGDVVMEIRPGTGFLTNVLINAGATVLAIEKDPNMAYLVSERFAGNDQLKVVSNMPFNISTYVVKQLLLMGDIFSEIVLLLQETIVCHLQEPLNTDRSIYSQISIQVDAAAQTFKLNKETGYSPVTSIKSFFSMVNSAFNDKRKMLRKSLQHSTVAANIENALIDNGLPVTSRLEDLTMDEFVKLHNLITTIGEL